MQVVIQKVNRISVDSFTLKMIAITAMVADHVGYLFFPQIMIFRIVGRLTLPIMAFLITEGYRRTRDVKRYMVRLGIFALISMMPYHLVFQHSYFNMLFDLLFGLITIYVSDMLDKEWKKWGVVLFFFIIAFLIGTDGALGASVLVYLFHRYRNNFKKMTCAMVILYFLQVIGLVIMSIFTNNSNIIHNYTTWIRPFALCSLFLIYKYNGKRGKNIKYFFYVFYPGHLLILYLIYKFI